ncbi:MAG: AEC family transporter [Phycisphaeraceae bacterium]
MIHLLSDIFQIAWFIVLPVMLLVGLGFLIQKKIGLDMPTMVRLNFYVVVPGIVYFAVVGSRPGVGDVAKMVGFTLFAMAVWAGLAYTLAWLRGVPADQRRAMLMTSIFYNSGNYGLPVQELAFRGTAFGSAGATGLQVFVLIVQNISTFSLGILLAAGRPADGQWRKTLAQIARFPPIYALFAGLITISARNLLGEHAPTVSQYIQPFWDTVLFIKNGFIVVALVTLGAQLAVVERGDGKGPLPLAVGLRLIGGPVVGFILLKLLGWTGPVAQVLLISTAMPTAVNCMLICLEFDNHPAFVARTVFYATLLSPITVTLTILLAHSGTFGPAGALP